MKFKYMITEENKHGLNTYTASIILYTEINGQMNSSVIGITTAFSTQAAITQATHMARIYQRNMTRALVRKVG